MGQDKIDSKARGEGERERERERGEYMQKWPGLESNLGRCSKASAHAVYPVSKGSATTQYFD